MKTRHFKITSPDGYEYLEHGNTLSYWEDKHPMCNVKEIKITVIAGHFCF